MMSRTWSMKRPIEGNRVSAGFGKLATSVIGRIRYAQCGSNSVCQLPGSESIRATSQGEDRTEYSAGSGLVQVDATDSGLADLGGSRKLIQRFIAEGVARYNPSA